MCAGRCANRCQSSGGPDAGGEDAPDRARAEVMVEWGESSLDAAMPQQGFC